MKIITHTPIAYEDDIPIYLTDDGRFSYEVYDTEYTSTSLLDVSRHIIDMRYAHGESTRIIWMHSSSNVYAVNTVICVEGVYYNCDGNKIPLPYLRNCYTYTPDLHAACEAARLVALQVTARHSQEMAALFQDWTTLRNTAERIHHDTGC